MDYIKQNKMAWEEAYDNKKDGWGNDVVNHIRENSSCYIDKTILKVLEGMDLSNKVVAQFCCNNGRELLSISKSFLVEGIGFDIADNLIDNANFSAKELGLPCVFIATNVLEIDSKYDSSFDVAIFTIGAITWFKDLNELFKVVSKYLKPNGVIILHDFHPLMNMMPIVGEELYNKDRVTLLEDKYFSNNPWIENNGMSYISGEYESKTFTSFSHSISNIFNGLIKNDINITSFDEFDYDIGLSTGYDDKGFPLSFLLVGKKS